MSIRDATQRPMTIEEYSQLPVDDRYRDELVRGYIVREPRPNTEHGWLAARLAHALIEIVEQHRAGIVVCESGFILEHEPPTVRGPDVAFISASRLTQFPSGYVDAA